MSKPYSAVIWATRDGHEGTIGVTHINDAFRTKEAGQRWIDNQLPSFEYMTDAGYTLHSEVN